MDSRTHNEDCALVVNQMRPLAMNLLPSVYTSTSQERVWIRNHGTELFVMNIGVPIGIAAIIYKFLPKSALPPQMNRGFVSIALALFISPDWTNNLNERSFKELLRLKESPLSDKSYDWLQERYKGNHPYLKGFPRQHYSKTATNEYLNSLPNPLLTRKVAPLRQDAQVEHPQQSPQRLPAPNNQRYPQPPTPLPRPIPAHIPSPDPLPVPNTNSMYSDASSNLDTAYDMREEENVGLPLFQFNDYDNDTNDFQDTSPSNVTNNPTPQIEFGRYAGVDLSSRDSFEIRARKIRENASKLQEQQRKL